MKRKLLTAFLCSSMLLNGIPVTVLAQEVETGIQTETAIIHSGTIGTADWTIDSNGVLTIGAGEFTNNDDEDYKWPWRSYRLSITRVDGTAKFKVTGSLAGMFAYGAYPSSRIESIDLSGFDTSNVTDMSDMFYNCSGLTSLDLSPLDTSNVTSMGSMFEGCSGLTSLDLSPLDTSNVTDMWSMFDGCSGLTSLDLSPLDTSNVTDMRFMFGGCSGLTSLDLSSLDTSNVTDMSDMFHACSSLTSLDLSSFDTSNVTSMWYMFRGCSSLATIRYSQKGASVLDMLPEKSGWYQNNKGPYTISNLPTVPDGATAVLTREKTTAKPIKMHRLYNPNSGEHFYTANTAEKDYLVKVGWKYEGEGWKAPEKSNTPVYRLYNANAGDHHYTLNENEKNALVKLGWKYEGIGWYSDDAKTVPLYREYNPNAKAGSHNYTPNEKEHKFLTSNGWKDEGIAWYGMK